MAPTPCAAERAHRPFRLLEGLAAVDRRLNFWVEVLHADGDARDAGAREGGDAVVAQIARVDLDGEFGIAANAEMCALHVWQVRRCRRR